jgi:hypothetical protein
MINKYYIIVTSIVICLCIVQNVYGQTNKNNKNKTYENADAISARTYLSCYNGNMCTLMLQTLFDPP